MFHGWKREKDKASDIDSSYYCRLSTQTLTTYMVRGIYIPHQKQQGWPYEETFPEMIRMPGIKVTFVPSRISREKSPGTSFTRSICSGFFMREKNPFKTKKDEAKKRSRLAFGWVQSLKTEAAGNWTRIWSVTGINSNHYTTAPTHIYRCRFWGYSHVVRM